MANDILSDRTLGRIADIMSKHAEAFVELTKDNLVKADGVSSGNLLESIRFEVEVLGQDVQIQILMADYAEFVDEGRGPGKFPPVNAIKQWIREKGIVFQQRGIEQSNRTIEQRNDSAAFVIGRSIARKGTQGKNFIPEFDTQSLIEEIEEDIADSVAEDIKAVILESTTLFS